MLVNLFYCSVYNEGGGEDKSLSLQEGGGFPQGD